MTFGFQMGKEIYCEQGLGPIKCKFLYFEWLDRLNVAAWLKEEKFLRCLLIEVPCI